MKKSFWIISLCLFICSGCDNTQYVGTWKNGVWIIGCGFPMYAGPTEIVLNSDYSYTTTGGFNFMGSPGISGTYSLNGDSIFLGTDSLLRFRVTLIDNHNLHFERNGDDSTCFTMWFRFTR